MGYFKQHNKEPPPLNCPTLLTIMMPRKATKKGLFFFLKEKSASETVTPLNKEINNLYVKFPHGKKRKFSPGMGGCVLYQYWEPEGPPPPSLLNKFKTYRAKSKRRI